MDSGLSIPHRGLTRYASVLQGTVTPRFRAVALDDRIERAFDILNACELCSRRCLVDRTRYRDGWCHVGSEMVISSFFEHLGEEDFFVPSFTVFFPSCTFGCVFCQNWDISQVDPHAAGQVMTEIELAEEIDRHARCRNVNFVGGEPTPYLPFVLKTLKHMTADIPVVWNSNFYMSEISMKLLEGVVDVYLSDLKYGNDHCARRLSDVDDYSEIVRENHRMAAHDSELVIRHLVMPGHVDCCSKPILEFIADAFGDSVVVNLMEQYRPAFHAYNLPEINRRISRPELEAVLEYARLLKLDYMT
jgi:putative pyruvate formate lyase activating enzyme